MLRAWAIGLLALAMPAGAWVESVEFPWENRPRQVWERDLAWFKEAGFTHISLPQGRDPAALADAIRIVRALGLEADLEGPVPESLQPLARAHGGPLTDPLPAPRAEISALAPDATTKSRQSLESGSASLLWIDAVDTLGSSGYRAGALGFRGEERPAAAVLRRAALLAGYWSAAFPQFREVPGVGVRTGVSVKQFTAENGLSVISVVNDSATAWTGDVKALYPALKRVIGLPAVAVPAHGAAWLPVNVPLTAGPQCRGCSAFGLPDHLVYATAELTAMEYENGILALEFSASAPGEVVLQLSTEPYGPYLAGGKPTSFDWDEHEHRARLTFPAGSGPASRVRIGLGIEPPDSTAFFPNAKVLTIGETNTLKAEYSSEAITGRSRLIVPPGFSATLQPGPDPLTPGVEIRVPAAAVPGDLADLAMEADGGRLSHSKLRLLPPAELAFPDQIQVRVARDAALPLYPATIPANQRAGRDIAVTIRNNAPEIRNFTLALEGEGLDFSPAKLDVTVGASVARDVSFRVFTREAAPGVSLVTAKLTGAATATETIRLVVLPRTGAVSFVSGRFAILESAETRAVFLTGDAAGRWLEFTAKDRNRNALAPGGVPFIPGTIKPDSGALTFSNGRTLGLADLETLLPHKP